jgi:hypothetical protein
LRLHFLVVHSLKEAVRVMLPMQRYVKCDS